MTSQESSTALQSHGAELVVEALAELQQALPKGKAHFERAAGRLSRGTSRARFWEPMPIYVDRAEGAYLFDVDGRRYCDYNLGQGALVLGHCHPVIVAALEEQLARGTHFGPQTRHTRELAELIVSSVPGAERVAFVNSGTEATMGALRIARKATGRSKIGKFEGGWHGANEFTLQSFVTLSGPVEHPEANRDSLGVSLTAMENVVVLPFNEDAAFDRIREEADALACVIIEPVLGGGGSIPATPEFLAGLRAVCDETGVVLILDEVITGFRLGPNCAAGRYGIVGDLTTLGKAVGGGQPVGVICGRGDLMDRTMWPGSGTPGDAVFAGGTFSGNPMTTAAGAAMLSELLGHPEHYDHLEALGDRLRDGLRRDLAERGIRGYVTGLGSMIGLHLVEHEPKSERDLQGGNALASRLLRIYLELDGFISRGMSFISTAHTVDDVDGLVRSYGSAFDRLQAESCL